VLAVCGSLAAQVPVFTKSIGGNRTDTTGAVAIDPRGNVYVVGTTNSTNFPRTQNNPAQPLFTNLLISTDGGTTFSRGLINNPVLALASVGTTLLAGTTAGPYRSIDGGASWQASNASVATNGFLTDARFPARAFAATVQGLYRSDDAGVSWAFAGPTKTSVNVIASSPLRPDVIFILASEGIFRSQDGGQTWQKGSLPISPTGPAPTSVTIDPADANTVYIAGAYSNTIQQAFILKSTDGGATFQQISAQAVLTATQAIAIDPSNPKSLFAAGITGTVYHSVDGGANWTATALTNVTLDAIAFRAGNLYALSDQGLYVSTDRGVTWQPTATGVPKRDLRAILFTSTAILIGADQGEHTFLTKWSSVGAILWSIVIGGSYFDDAVSVAIDTAGNPYIAGTTGSTDFPITSGAFQSTLNSFQNVFLMKFNPDGDQLLYSTYLGGSGSDNVSALAVDAAGSAYLTGYAVSSDFPTTTQAYQRRHNGTCGGHAGGDAYVTKFSPTASALAYSTLIGGSCTQVPTSLALDASGHAYIAGATVSPDFPVTQGALQPVFGGQTDGFLSELTPTGDALIFSTYLGGQNSDVAAGVAVDANGNIYVAGNGDGFSFAPAPSTSQVECDGSLITYGGLSLSVQASPYYLKLAAGGGAIASLQTFSDCGTVVKALGLDPSGKAWLGGIADTSNYDTVAPFQTLAAGSYFLREYAPDAKTTLFSTLLDGFQSVAIGDATYVAAGPVSLSKIDSVTVNPVVIDSVQRYGTLSIPALASFSGPMGIAPGELLVINGHGFTSGTGVQVDGVNATLAGVQSNRIVCVVPNAVNGKKRSQIQATNSNAVTVSAVAADVEVLILVNQDGSINSKAKPAPAGSVMTLYASGLGVDIAQTQVFFDDAAPITYLGQAPGLISGVTQINYVVPNIPGQSILSLVNGASTDYVYIYLK
jgi:uncharacterized protein (TIGR03437 family)